MPLLTAQVWQDTLRGFQWLCVGKPGVRKAKLVYHVQPQVTLLPVARAKYKRRSSRRFLCLVSSTSSFNNIHATPEQLYSFFYLIVKMAYPVEQDFHVSGSDCCSPVDTCMRLLFLPIV
jgi:hypothetical protein